VTFASEPPAGSDKLSRVEIDAGNGIYVEVLHLDGIAVKEGDRVEAGTYLGKPGTHGTSLGPHAHITATDENAPASDCKGHQYSWGRHPIDISPILKAGYAAP
jgi:murein DD-endopeptidase MepM/ murein hydrolase activator NlpD